MCVCIRPVGGLARHNRSMRMLLALRFSFYSFDAAVGDDDEIVISLAQHTSSTTNAIRARPSFEQHFITILIGLLKCSIDRSFPCLKVRIEILNNYRSSDITRTYGIHYRFSISK